MDRCAAHLVVSGRVQGVGYRWFVRDAAVALGLSGSVRNRKDGSVEVEVAGTRALIEDFARTLQVGPPSAAVRAVTVQWLPVPLLGGGGSSVGPARFDIRPTG